MQAIPTTHMILPEGILSTIDGTQLIPVETTSRFLQKNSQGVSIVELGKKLLKASKDGNTDQVRDLMSKGAPFTTDWLGTSPLHFAALNNHFDTCEVLLRAGISRDSRTKVDRTPLHMAAYEGHINVVELLLSNGANVDSCDMLKMTPLHWAVQNGHADVVTLLLRNGANPDVINKFGKSPVDISIEVNRLDILHLLQVITKDPIDATQSLALELGAEDKMEEVIKHQETMQKHFLDQDDESEHKIVESLETAHVEVQHQQHQHQQHTNTTNVDFTDSIQMLKEHGISFLPADNSSVVASAVENGHSLVLTEVGKQVLNSTKPLVRLPVQKSQITKINGRQVIAIRPDQFLALQNSSNNQQNRVPIVIKNTTQKPFKKIVMNKNKIIYSATPNVTNATKRIRIENVIKTTPPVAATPVNIELIQRQLAEARREAEEYRQMLKRKEAEAERYKRQLQSITQQSK